LGAIVLWAVATYVGVREFRRTGRKILNGQVEQEVREMFGSPEEIGKRVQEAPDNRAAAVKYAFMAEQEQDWPELVVRAGMVAERFPMIVHGHLLLARGLWHSDRQPESRAALAKALRKFPEYYDLQQLAVVQAGANNEWRRALRLAKRLRYNFHQMINGYAYEMEALVKLGRLRQAEKVLVAAEKEMPGHPFLETLWKQLEDAEEAASTNRTAPTA
jgi:hypothetical protein